MKSPCLALLLSAALAQAASPPVVSNIRPSQIAGTKNVQILYDVSDADGDALTITIQISGDAGLTYTIPATALSGHIGANVSPGNNRSIIWNAGVDWNGQLVTTAKVRIAASDGTFPAPPPGMAYIPSGPFQMGGNLDGMTDALPTHNVQVDAFFMDRTEVSKELWQSVQSWSTAHGYTGLSAGTFAAAGHPVQTITWYDMVKWCNARSEKENLTPVYYTDLAQTVVYRTGNVNLTNALVKWTANGYRLPTEAEWEKAARGGPLGKRYPWGDTIAGSQANYSGSGDPFEAAGTPTTPVGYYNGSQVPAGVDMANGYGLYDMSGNVWEWCWDWYDATYYGNAAANNNPRGPAAAQSYRVPRGGAWFGSTYDLLCARRFANAPGNAVVIYGFRCVRGL
jgi:formylglycine-generating enzyme required for sulfatase activity